MSTEREELADIIADHQYCGSCAAEGHHCAACLAEAEAILAAGYHKPRTITTVAELDALPVGAIVLDSTDSDWRKVDYSNSCVGTDHRWATAGWEVGYSAKEVELPATVLHTPEGGN